MISGLLRVFLDALFIYGVTFLCGFITLCLGVTLESHPFTTYSGNLLSGALGFALISSRRGEYGPRYFALVASGMWFLGLANVTLRLQTIAAWLNSGLTILLMASLGRGITTLLTYPASLKHSASRGSH
ncbi:MAG: hypothetical protein NBKEAIPA_02554 [Nitrospirae bacterium]|nr:MAG: hypothetical protein UZ03_NOB001000530 [Nitrospira sp. OLB3]MBV6470638.1 hypothetical protein [Nitrospirota bacterium]MCE7965455.1 hypothetical protein [Nitrospira sp. NTP2]RIK60011.1 MAG: hypothetical protein DCC63_05500 [Nitrospira sp.]